MPHPANANPAPVSRAGASPFGAVLALTFINSLGTGVVTNGIFFLTASPSYGFSRSRNYALGVVLGITYILGALGAGPALSALRRRFPNLSSRRVLVGLMISMAALCVIPWAAQTANHLGAQWPIWLLVVLYSPLTGVLWPLVESYVSGGKSGPHLRSQMGIWNVVWSGAVVLSYWGMSPLVESHAAATIFGLGGLHLLAIPFILACGKEPAPHIEEHHEPHPPVYTKLLVTFRLLLPMSYVVSSTLGPYLPGAMESLGVPVDWRAFLAAAWLVPRVFTFFTLQRWHGWHGRWSMAVVGGGLLLLGFAVCVVSPVILAGTPAVALLLCGLFMFGTGMATIYMGALYYAMEVGKAEVDAAGMHEALIGFGYTVGPAVGLVVSAAVDYGTLKARTFEPTVLGAVSVMAVGVTAMVLKRIHSHATGTEASAKQ
ncbi:MAG: hypothetical protein JSR77_12275 [Planctomycetes bacterium]|nr:hypothetical protein [Planctomycetota bacterium]